MSIDSIRSVFPVLPTLRDDAASLAQQPALQTRNGDAAEGTMQLDPLVLPAGMQPWAGSGGAATAGASAVNAPAASNAAAPATPLDDPALTPLLEMSPTLQADLDALQADGYTVRWGNAGGGSWIDSGAREIVIDSNMQGNGTALAMVIAHETGHHKFSEPDNRDSKDEMVMVLLRDEAAATINNAQVRNEILAAGGPDIGFPGIHAAEYQAITDQLLSGEITQEEALSQIAEQFKTEQTSTTGQTYEEYYGQGWTLLDEIKSWFS